MKIHQLDVEGALHSLHSQAAGLASAEAGRRLLEFGPNRVERVQRTPALLHLCQGFTHFFALILWVAAGLAFVAEWQDPGAGMAILGLAILGVIVINGLFSFWQEYRAERAMASLLKLLPHQVKVARDGQVRQVAAEALVPGDVILLEGGDDIPADCRLLEAFGVRVNNATVTGESIPQARDAAPCQEEDLYHGRNILLAGTSLVSGQGRALVFATGMRTELGQIAHLTQDSREPLSPLQKEIRHLSHLVALLAVGLGAVFFCLGQALGLSFWVSSLFAIGIIVANVPEGLLPTVTLALAMGSQRMARKNALIRHLPSVETLGSATVICTDKTGTLTQNRMAARQVFLSRRLHKVGDGVSPRALAAGHAPFFQALFLCHDLKEVVDRGRRRLLGDPMEVALVRLAQESGPGPTAHPRIDEHPFDSSRKRLSTLHETPEGLVLYSKGAVEALLPLCRQVLAEGRPHPLDEEERRQVLQAQDAMAAQGLRVLAVAYRPFAQNPGHDHLEEDLILAGLVGLEDPPRPEVPAAIAKCREAGIKVIMATGDHPHTALAVAREIGLVQGDQPVVITGDKLRRMSQTQLQLALDLPEVLFARVAADQKMRLVRALKAKGHVVAVTGDGVNDAPALRQADIGIAMGLTGTDVARASADMILLDDNFASIVAAIEEGRAVFANIRKFLSYILTSNVPELIPYLAFFLLRIPLALTIIQILAVDLGTDMLPALALGAEKPEPGLMRQPPRSRRQRLIDWRMLARSYLFLGPLEALAGMAAFFFVLGTGGWGYGEVLAPNSPLYLQATTACLSAIIISQVVNVFLCRSERASVLSAGMRGGRLIWAGIVTELALILLIVYTPWGNRIFGTAPISGHAWLFMLPFAGAMLILEELRKWLVRAVPGRWGPIREVAPAARGLAAHDGRPGAVGPRAGGRAEAAGAAPGGNAEWGK